MLKVFFILMSFSFPSLNVYSQTVQSQNITSVFNLKGFHLNMTKEDVKKLMSTPKFNQVAIFDGKELSGISCGVVAGGVVGSQPPSGCSFTYAGEQITGITVSFWGDRPYEIQLYFGAYRPKDHSSASVHIDQKMKQSLDIKYQKESNTTGPNGNAGTIWSSGVERIKMEYVTDRNFNSNSLSLTNPEYKYKVENLYSEFLKNKQNSINTNSKNKALSDM